jgi:hypothetical protein
MISPMLARFDSLKSVFLDTYWSASGIGSILIQPDGSDKSKAGMENLVAGDANEFDTNVTGAGLGSVLFGSWNYGDRDTHYHFMAGKAALERWEDLHNDSLLHHHNPYAMPHLRYVNHCLGADPMSALDIYVSDPARAHALMLTICSPRMIHISEHLKLFRPISILEM